MTGWKIHFFGYNSPTDCLIGTKFCTKTQNLMVEHSNFFGKFMIADRFAPKLYIHRFYNLPSRPIGAIYLFDVIWTYCGLCYNKKTTCSVWRVIMFVCWQTLENSSCFLLSIFALCLFGIVVCLTKISNINHATHLYVDHFRMLFTVINRLKFTTIIHEITYF